MQDKIPQFVFDVKAHYGQELTTVMEELMNEIILHYNSFIVDRENNGR